MAETKSPQARRTRIARKARTFLQKHLDDLLIVAGSGLLVYATSMLSLVAMVYVAGAILIIFGVLIGLGVKK